MCSKKQKIPSNRIRTSDLRISAIFPLQSSALPTELSRDRYKNWPQNITLNLDCDISRKKVTGVVGFWHLEPVILLILLLSTHKSRMDLQNLINLLLHTEVNSYFSSTKSILFHFRSKIYFVLLSLITKIPYVIKFHSHQMVPILLSTNLFLAI